MELVLAAAIVAISFGAAATWLLATRLPEHWHDKSASEGRYAQFGLEESETEEADSRLQQARTDVRRVRRARVRTRLQSAARMVRALRPANAHGGRNPAARP